MQGRTPLFREVMRTLALSTPELINRRDFLRRASAASAGLLASSCASIATRQPRAPVAIIGAGIAGLTAAYRLAKQGLEVHLYEASERAGGRMFTRRGFNADGQFVELGAELVDTNHTDLMALAQELGVEMQNLRRGEKGLDFYWFDGVLRTDHEILAAFRPLGLKIAADAEGLTDAQEAYTAKARALDGVSLAAYLHDRGRGVRPWVIDLLIAAYEPELGVEAAKQSCLNLIGFINPDTSKGFEVFGDSDEAWRIKGGNSTLPEALHATLKGRCDIHFGQRLTHIGYDEGAGQVRLRFTSRAGARTVSYGQVICALPFTVLRGVGGISGLPLSANKKRCIREMGYGRNVKVFHSFTHRVWRQPVTGRPFIGNGSVFAAARTFQNVWETSRGQAGARGIITNLLGGRRGENYSPGAMAGFLGELDKVLPGTRAAFDGRTGAMNWPKNPLALGSYSCPLVGQYTWIYEASPTPELGGRLLFAGEHTSSASAGFMNGGVESGNRAAREALAYAANLAPTSQAAVAGA